MILVNQTKTIRPMKINLASLEESIHQAIDTHQDVKIPDGHICDLSFYVKGDKIEVDNIYESTTNITYTSVWEQICLRCL